MHFTPQEKKLIERLRKQEHQQRLWRWCVLGLGIISALLCAFWSYVLYGMVTVSPQGALEPKEVFLLIVMYTKCGFWLIMATWAIATAWIKWHGDVNRILVLKMLDAVQKHEPPDNLTLPGA